MPRVQRSTSTVGPVAVGGRTLTFVTRTHTIGLMRSDGGFVHVRARPHQVEVLDAGGVREVLPVHDVQWLVMSAIVGGAAACVAGEYCAKRLWRRTP